MTGISMRTFESIPEAAFTAANLFRGPTFASTFINMDGKFREKMILAVSIANNCGM